MTKTAELEREIQELSAASSLQRAQIVGLATVIANLPGVEQIDRSAVDAMIETECQNSAREVREAAIAIAHSVLKSARDHAKPGVYGSGEGQMRGFQRGG